MAGCLYSCLGSSPCAPCATLDKSTWAYKAVSEIEDSLSACWPRHNGTERNHRVTPRQNALLRTAYTELWMSGACVDAWVRIQQSRRKMEPMLGIWNSSIWNFCTGGSRSRLMHGIPVEHDIIFSQRCSLSRQPWQRLGRNVTFCNNIHNTNTHM